MAGESERRETFSRLIEEYGVALRRLAGAYLSDPAAREDLFQEIEGELERARRALDDGEIR